MNDCSPEMTPPVEVALQGDFRVPSLSRLGRGRCPAIAYKRTWSLGTRRGMGPSVLTQIVEITSGRANFQQGLTATCKDLPNKKNKISKEDFGLAHESV